MDEWLMNYVDKFGKNFPLFAVKAKTEKEIIQLIKDSIKSGKPFEADIDPNVALY